MSFLQPLALLGLALAAVPPLLHLISRRIPPLVPFPALRYLAETERRQSRRLRLRHLLLMVLRTALIALIALAASRPVTRWPFGGGHEPSSLVLVVDNSLSSAAVVGGRRVLDVLVDRAEEIVARTGADDRLWLMTADGVPRALDPQAARAFLDTLGPVATRFDVGEGVRVAASIVAGQPTAGQEVVVLSDLQAAALSGGEAPGVRVLVWEAPAMPEFNRGIDTAWAQPEIWTPDGQVVSVLGGTGTAPTTVRLSLNGTVVDRGFGAVGDRVVLGSRGAVPPGWRVLSLDLDPDEFRADDHREIAVYVAAPAAVTAAPGSGRFVVDAVDILREAGRVRAGPGVRIDDRVGPGPLVLVPPADDAMLGAVNRDLARRGVGWRFGDERRGAWSLGPPWVSDTAGASGAGTTVSRRRVLEGNGVVVATLDGEPWIVRGGEVVVVGSRLDPDWTSLPVSAGFLPFLDLLLNRVAARPVMLLGARPGAPLRLTGEAVAVVTPAGDRVPGPDGRLTAPLDPGVYFLRGADGDTVGALAVHPDPRESRLTAAGRAAIRNALGAGTQILGRRGIDRELFGGARRGDLTGVLLALAVLLGIVELLVATLGGGRGDTEDEAG